MQSLLRRGDNNNKDLKGKNMVSLLKTLGFFPELVITNANKGAAPIYAGGLKLLTGKALGSLSSVEVAADGGDGWYE
jgi:hypothetical protein